VPNRSDPASAETAPRRLLVVDDDPDIVDLLGRYFRGHGFEVSRAADGSAMRIVLAAEIVDLVLLDLGLPGEDGLELLHHLRAEHRCAVIVVTGRGDAVDRVVGLELGADDYVAKPFDLRELLARVRSVLRRSGATEPPRVVAASSTTGIRFEGFQLDPTSRRLHAPNGDEIVLTTGEFELLEAFIEQPNRVLSRDSLMNRIHGREAGPFDRAIDVQVGRLRRKLEPDNDPPQLIKAVRGAGYLFAGRVERG
jgi:two-component system, OmpR family, response regulator